MARFLAPIPEAAALAALLHAREPLSSRAYEDETETARFVESDGTTVLCFTIAGITIDQAEMIEWQREQLAAVNEAEFRRAVERALHLTLDPGPGG
jgi:hypothetical protein